MTIAAGICVAWPGSRATIPSGWNAQDALAGQYVRGSAASVNPGSVGGFASHTHTASTHSHTIQAHNHAGGLTSDGSVGGTGYALNALTPVFHTHVPPTTANDAGTDALGSTIATWASSVNDPANLSVIWMQSDGTPTVIPQYAVAIWNSSTLPTGWMQHAALKGAFAKGAAAATGDGGVFTSANSHTHLTVAHTHAPSGGHTHSVSGTTAASVVDSTWGFAAGGTAVVDGRNSHTHSVSITTLSGTDQANVASGGGAASSSVDTRPPYLTVAYIQNGNGSNGFPPNVIAVWLGTLATIPTGWVICDGTNSTPDLRTQFPRGANNLSELGTTGGTGSHTHTSSGAHSHALAGHAHSSNGFTTGSTAAGTVGGVTVSQHTWVDPHAHTFTTGSAATLASQTALDASTVTDTRPPYYDVAFIQFQFSGTISVTTPAAAGTVATPFFSAAWLLSGGRTQVSYHVVIYDSGGTTVVWDSGVVASATQSATVPTVPAGPPYPASVAPGLVSGTSYKFQVTCVDSGGQSSQSAQVSFSASWTTPTIPSGLAATPVGGV